VAAAEARPDLTDLAAVAAPFETNSVGVLRAQPGTSNNIGRPFKLQAVSVARDDAAGKRFLETWPESEIHASGVVGLHRLEGDDRGGRRYAHQFFVGRAAGSEACAAKVFCDWIDRRARILSLQSQLARLHAAMLKEITEDLRRQARGRRFVIVVDVQIGAISLQTTLEALGFVPTVYYPGLLGKGSLRYDAVQYTLVLNGDFDESVPCAGAIDWKSARVVIDKVAALFRRQPASLSDGSPTDMRWGH
jgi:hypothetical protein